MRFKDPLDVLFRTKSHVRVLRELYRLPVGYGVSAREVARRAGISHPTASSVLAGLTDEGVTRRQRAVRADVYKLNHQHVLAECVIDLFKREESLRPELVSFLKDELRRNLPSAQGAFLFGSAARGEATEASDIDIAIIGGDVTSMNASIEEVSEAVHRRFGNRLNVLFGTPKDIDPQGSKARLRAVWRRVIEDGIRII